MDFNRVIDFWFNEIKPENWWKKDSQFDALIRERFTDLHNAAIKNELYSWRESPEGSLAEIIILDQFSRNMFRDHARSFAHDAQALALSQQAVSKKFHLELDSSYVPFLLMPYMHSESAIIHEQAVILFKEFAPGNLEFEFRHKAIVDRFGRYPHRNDVLGRESTEEEREFLKQEGSSF